METLNLNKILDFMKNNFFNVCIAILLLFKYIIRGFISEKFSIFLCGVLILFFLLRFLHSELKRLTSVSAIYAYWFAALFTVFLALPSGIQSTLSHNDGIVLFGSLAVILFLGVSLVKIIRGWRSSGKRGLHRYEDALLPVMTPSMARLSAIEINLMMVAFFKWKPDLDEDDHKKTKFYYHVKSVDYTVMLCMIGLSIVEISIMHVLISIFNKNLSWILTDIGIIGVFYVIGLAKSLRWYPTLLGADSLTIRVGALRDITVPRSAITDIGRVSARAPRCEAMRAFLFDPPNIRVAIRRDALGERFAHHPEPLIKIDFRVDEPDLLIKHVQENALSVPPSDPALQHGVTPA